MTHPTNEVQTIPPGPSGSIAHMEEEFRELERMSRPRWPLALALVLLLGAAAAGRFWLGRTPRAASVARPVAVQGVPIEPRALRELENVHRTLISMHLEKTLKSDRVLRDLRRHA